MSISRERILLSAYNQIISRGYEELSSHFVNYVLHLTELPHGQKGGVGKQDLKCHLKKIQYSDPSLFPSLPSPPSHMRKWEGHEPETRAHSCQAHSPDALILNVEQMLLMLPPPKIV